MAASVENESEILLGNKQLLAVFAVVAFLLAVAFTGGYMLGKSSAEKKTAAGAEIAGAASANDPAAAAGPVTKTVTPDDQPAAKTDPPPAEEPKAEDTKAISVPEPRPGPAADRKQEPVLGTPKTSLPESVPRHGQTFVQVAALTRPQAEATADVLRKQNFPARIAPKPGSTSIFRVLVGPVKDSAEITSTRDALRKIGFRDVIVQRY